MAEEQGKPPRKRGPRSRPGAEPAAQPNDGYGYGDEHGHHPDEAVGAHAEFVAAHFGGGAAATPDLLDRAIDVWQRLPGAVVQRAATIRPNRPASDLADDPPASDPGEQTR
jgi:hypothetical protein